jgi:hypothetical protein
VNKLVKNIRIINYTHVNDKGCHLKCWKWGYFKADFEIFKMDSYKSHENRECNITLGKNITIIGVDEV